MSTKTAELFASYQKIVFDYLEKDCVLEADIIFANFMGEYQGSSSLMARLLFDTSRVVEDTRITLALARASLIERKNLKYDTPQVTYSEYREKIITLSDYDSCPDRMKKLVEKIHERHLTETEDLM